MNNKPTERLAAEYKKEIEKNPSSGRVIDVLAELERSIIGQARGEILARTEKVLRSEDDTKAINEELQNLGLGQSIEDVLDDVDKKAREVIEYDDHESIEDLAKRLGAQYDKHFDVIVEPLNAKPFVEQGKGYEYRENKSFPEAYKLKLLLVLLRKINVFPEDLFIKPEILRKEMMREIPYLYIAIPKIDRCLLLNPGYREATFVFPKMYSRYEVSGLTKKDYEGMGAIGIPFDEQNIPQWEHRIIEVLNLDNEKDYSPVDMNEYAQKQIYIDEMIKLYPTPQSFMNIADQDRRKIDIKGKKLTRLVSIICGNGHGLSPLSNNHDFIVFAQHIYGYENGFLKQLLEKEEKKLEKKEWPREKWIEEIKKKFPTPEKFMNMHWSKRGKLNLHGFNLDAIATAVFGKSTSIRNLKELALLGREIFGEGHEVIECEFWEKKDWINKMKEIFPTPKDFMEMPKKLKSGKFLHRFTLALIGKILTGIRELKTAERLDLATIAREIYDPKENGYELIDCEFWNTLRWKTELKKQIPNDPKEFIKMTVADRKAIEIAGYKLTGIAGKLGLKGSLPVINRKDLARLGQVIFGIGHDIIDCELWGEEGWISLLRKELPATREGFDKLSGQQLRNIKVLKKGVQAIMKEIFGGVGWNPAENLEHRKMLRDAIY